MRVDGAVGLVPRRRGVRHDVADLGALLSGAVVTEGIFNIPGLGRAVFQAIQSQEGNVVVGIVTLFVFVYIMFNLLVDVMYAALDPRIRYE